MGRNIFSTCVIIFALAIIFEGLPASGTIPKQYHDEGSVDDIVSAVNAEFGDRFMNLRNDFKHYLEEMYQSLTSKHAVLENKLLKSQLRIQRLEEIVEEQNAFIIDMVGHLDYIENGKEPINERPHSETTGAKHNTQDEKNTARQEQNANAHNDRRSITRLFTDAEKPHTDKNNYAFSVYLEKDKLHRSAEYAIRFNGTIINEGNHYSAVTGHYTVPANGTYVFQFSFMTSSDSRPCVASIMVDGVPYSSGYSDPRRQNSMGGNLVVAYLTEGQLVWIENQSDNCDYIGKAKSRTTTFSGFFLG